MNKHQIFTYTSKEDLSFDSQGSIVTVYWQVQFDRSLDRFMNKRKYTHNLDLLKEGIGKLDIRIEEKSKEISDKHLIAYAETLAAKHLVSTRGLNVFGFTDDSMTIRRDQIHLYVSQPDTVDFIDRSGGKDEKLKTTLPIVGPSTAPLAAYLYGATISLCETNQHLKEAPEFDFFNKSTDMIIRGADNIRTDFSEIIIDYRTVEEFLSTDYIRYTITEKGAEYSRVYNTIADFVSACTDIQYDAGNFVKKTQLKFGQDALVAASDQFLFQLIPHRSDYLVFGMKKLMSAALKVEMAKAGYGDNFELPTEEDVQESLRRRELLRSGKSN